MAESQGQRCIAPGTTSDEDRLAWVRGDAGPAVEEHLSRCQFCRNQAAGFAQTEAALRHTLYRRTCPPSMTLGEYALGMLDPDDAIAVAQHLLECGNCAEERRRFSAFLAEPDEPLRSDNPVSRVLRRLLAQPLAAPEPALALRGEEDESVTVYALDGYELTLSVQSAGGATARTIVGLLLGGPPPEGSTVRLFAGERVVQTTTVDDLGNFILEAVARGGDYRLELVLADTAILVDPLRVA